MDSRVTVVLMAGQRYEIDEKTVPQNIDAILVIEDNDILLWKPGMRYAQVNGGSEMHVCYERCI